jgi:ribosomal protein L4
MKLKIFSNEGSESGESEFDIPVFEDGKGVQAVKEVIVAQAANGRQGRAAKFAVAVRSLGVKKVPVALALVARVPRSGLVAVLYSARNHATTLRRLTRRFVSLHSTELCSKERKTDRCWLSTHWILLRRKPV